MAVDNVIRCDSCGQPYDGEGPCRVCRGELVVLLHRDQAQENWSAYADGHDIISGWHGTPEAALVAFCEAARKKLKAIGAMSNRSAYEDGLTGTYLVLSRTFGKVG